MNCLKEGMTLRKNLESMKKNSYEGVKPVNNNKKKKYWSVKSEQIKILLDILCKGHTNKDILWELYKTKKNPQGDVGVRQVKKCFENALKALITYKRAIRAGDDIILDNAKVKKINGKWSYVAVEDEKDI